MHISIGNALYNNHNHVLVDLDKLHFDQGKKHKEKCHLNQNILLIFPHLP